jgi:pimeloyl-ACP methyl ester carboxylesterase
VNAYRDLYWQSHDRLRLYARIYDAPHEHAPSVLCLPGLRASSRDFEDLAPHLQARYHVIAPDLRGRGLSARDRHATNYQPNVYVRDILKLLSVLDRRPVVVLGSALGGLIGMMLARAQPLWVTALILNDIGPEVAPAGRDRFLAHLGYAGAPADWADATQRLQQLYGHALPGLTAARWLVLARRLYREDAHGRVVLDCDAMVADVTRQAPASGGDLWPLWEQLKELPILAIRGGHSDILTAEILQRMAVGHPGLAQVTLEDRGHFPLLDEPAALQAIDRFLAEVTSPAPLSPSIRPDPTVIHPLR